MSGGCDARDRVTLGDLVGRHAAAGIPLGMAPNIWPLWDAVASTLEFSGIRLRSARPHPVARGAVLAQAGADP